MNDLLCLTQQSKYHQKFIQLKCNEWKKDYVQEHLRQPVLEKYVCLFNYEVMLRSY